MIWLWKFVLKQIIAPCSFGKLIYVGRFTLHSLREQKSAPCFPNR